MSARKRTLNDLTGWAERGGYIYAVLLRSGIVRAGRTDDARATVTALRKEARANGTDLADWWVSIPHEEWISNERALTEICRILDGKRTGPGCYSGVDFRLLTGKAFDLPYTTTAQWASGRRERCREAPDARDKRMAVAVRLHAQGMSVREIARRQSVSHTTIQNDLARWERVRGEMPLEILRLSRPAGNRTWQPDVPGPSSQEPCLPAGVATDASITPIRRLA
jgi:DNA-directed RNA polymerase specialized sigma24 family protein